MSKKHQLKRNMRRRTVLKTVGISITLSGLAGGAAANRPNGEVTGLAYDTMTDIISNRVSGRAVREKDSLKGNVSLAGYSIPLERLELAQSDQNDEETLFTAMLNDKRYKESDEPLSIRLFDHGDHFSGTISRPSPEFGIIGFHIMDAESYDAEKAEEQHDPAKKWKNHPASFSVPDKGIPRDSSPLRIIKLTENRDNQEGVDR